MQIMRLVSFLCFLSFEIILINCQDATEVKANVDIGSCNCDLTEGICDFNCCCDTVDCDDADRSSFTTCVDTYTFPDQGACEYRTLLTATSASTSSAKFQDESSSDIFCLQTDNYRSRNYYKVPTTLTTLSANTLLLADDSAPRFTFSSKSQVYPDNYTNGIPIYTMYSSLSPNQLKIPASVNSGLCTEKHSVGYMKNIMSTCGNKITNLESSCKAGSVLSAHYFLQDFKIARTPKIFQSGLPEYNSTDLLDFNITTVCTDVSGIVEACPNMTGIATTLPDVPPLEYDAATNTCKYALKNLRFNIKYTATSGISEIGVILNVGPITTANAAAGPIAQTFDVNFSPTSSGTSFARSGNPGYLREYPLLAAIKSTSSATGIVSIIHTTEGLTLPGPGQCKIGTVGRIPTKFQTVQRISCIKSFNVDVASQCAALQAEILQVLRGPNPANLVASFGNTIPSNFGDWLPVLENGCDGTSSSQPPFTCTSMITGQNIQIMYANIGAQVNQQAKIVGVRRQCVTGDLRYQCTGASCNPGVTASQNIEIVSTVTFLDVSEAAAPVYKSRPIFLARLPRDFFYPFWVENGAPTTKQNIFGTFVCIVIGYLLVLQL